MGRKKVARTLYFDPEMWAAVDKIAIDTRVPRSLLVREGVQRVVDYYTERSGNVLDQAEELAADVLGDSMASTKERRLARALIRLIDDVRQMRGERDEALAKAETRYAQVLELHGRIREMLGLE